VTRTTICESCGALVVSAHMEHSQQRTLLEPTGFGAVVWNDGIARWGTIYQEHFCQPSAVVERSAFVESVTTEAQRKSQQSMEEHRALVRQLALQQPCPKSLCGALAEEDCINLSVLKRQHIRRPTAWPHPERLALVEAEGGADNQPDDDVGSETSPVGPGVTQHETSEARADS